MIRKILIAAALAVCPFIGQAATPTTGFHRVSQVLARASSSSPYLVVQPYATVVVYNTSTGALATIYSDPTLTIPITGSTVTADSNGNYDYYVPLNFCVNEVVSYPLGGNKETDNICGNTGVINTPVALTNGGTAATSATAARASLSAAVSGVNSDITSLTGLSTPLPLTEGGTGSNSQSGAFASVVTPGGGISGALTGGSVNAVLNPAECGTSTAPSWCSGSDLGAWINAAGAHCSWLCKVEVPAGSYTQTTTILAPLNTNGKFALSCDQGASIGYIGGNYWFATYETSANPSNPGIHVENCKVTGTSSGLGGILILPAGGGVFLEKNVISGFTTGDGITVAGANTSTLRNNQIFGNKNGIRWYGNKCLTSSPFTCSPTQAGTTAGFSPNALDIDDNGIDSNTSYVIFEDETQGYATQNLNNHIHGGSIEANGTGILLTYSVGTTVDNVYFEANNGHNLVVGNGCCNNQGVNITHNYFTVGSGVPYTLELVTALNTVVSGNTELGTGSTCFVNQNTVLATYFGPNAVASTNAYCVGGSPGNAATDLVVSPAGERLQSPQMNSFQVNGLPGAYSSAGLFAGWNCSGGNAETCFVNVKGTGVGGFYFYNIATSGALSSAIFSIDYLGNITGTGNFSTTGSANVTTMYKVGGTQIAAANLSDGANISKYCGESTFTASTSGSGVSCSWVTASSHCTATWKGTPGAGILGVTTGTAVATPSASSSSTGTASVFCSAN